MKTDAERKFESLIKDMVENTDFESELDLTLKENGWDQIPEFEFLKDKNARDSGKFRKRNSRILKVAGFVIAVFIVSGIMTVAINSELAFAAKFKLDNFMFSIKNGFLSSDIQLNDITTGKELLIENEEQIAIGKDYLEELKIPEYIPVGYTFSDLRITNNPKNEYIATYTYKNDKDDMIMITQERLADYNRGINMVGIQDEFYIDETHIFYIPDLTSNYYAIYAFTEFELIYISGPLKRTDLTDILEMLK